MKKKFLYEYIIEFYRDKLPDYKKEAIEQQKQTDNLIVWIAGLSTASIGLILVKSDKIPLIDIVYLKISVGFFLLSLLSAVIFRSYFYSLQRKESQLLLTFESFCHASTCDFCGPIGLTEDDTIEDIAKALKEEMGIDSDHLLNDSSFDKDFWIKKYNRYSDFWEKQEQEGIKNLANAIAPILGVLPNDVDDKFIKKLTSNDNTEQIKQLLTLRTICSISYNGVLFSFLLAVLIVVFGFFMASI